MSSAILRQKSVFGHLVQHGDESIEQAAKIQYRNRSRVNLQLRPGDGFEQFFQRPITTG